MNNYLSKLQLSALVGLRVIIGWHFLYEGIIKFSNPDWSSIGYLIDSQGIFAGFFNSLASNISLMPVVDFLNIWGLILIGAGMILGLFDRAAVISGIVLLIMYYLSHPAFIGAKYVSPMEGNYLFVNKTMIEIFALFVLLVFPTSRSIGLDRFLFGKYQSKGE